MIVMTHKKKKKNSSYRARRNERVMAHQETAIAAATAIRRFPMNIP
jgi:hypothetical protein